MNYALAFLFIAAVFSQTAAAQVNTQGSQVRTGDPSEQRRQGMNPSNGGRDEPKFSDDTPRDSRSTKNKNYSKASFKDLVDAGERIINSEEPDYEKASYFLSQALKINPRSEKAFLLLGLSYNYQNLFAEAVDAYTHAIELNNKSVEASNGLGAVYFKQNNQAKSIEYFQQSVKLAPQNYTANFMLANCFYLQKQYQTAAEFYRKALVTEPQSIDAHYNLALCLIELKRVDEALKEKEILMTLNKEMAEKLGKLLKQ